MLQGCTAGGSHGHRSARAALSCDTSSRQTPVAQHFFWWQEALANFGIASKAESQQWFIGNKLGTSR